ncbi:hypothetical protein LX36DRAFT_708867 [Colletotrichum falcatum]|nr:hypothetical protein LX36DRAFT_708867 [Colletotrichum falcatum]
MARTSIFRLGSAFNAALLTCIILKHVSLALARSAVRHVCMALLMPIMLFHVAIKLEAQHLHQVAVASQRHLLRK